MELISDNQIPSIEYLTEAFERLEKMELSQSSFKEIKDAFMNEITLLPNLLMPQVNTNGIYYRARTNVAMNEDLTTISPFTYPKQNCSKGRANRVNFPVFYASVTSHTAIKEIKSDFKQNIYLGKWKITKRPNVQHFIYSNDDGLSKLWGTLNTILIEKVNKINSHLNDNSKKASEFLFSKCGDLFLKNKYELSSFLAHSYLYDSNLEFKDFGKISVVVYPSVADKEGINYAFETGFADSNLILESVVELNVTGTTETSLNIGANRIGINKDGIISWRAITNEDIYQFGFKD